MSRKIPKLCRHKRSGRAYVTDPTTGKANYLGIFGTAEAEEKYRLWVKDFLDRFRPGHSLLPYGHTPTISSLVEAYLHHAEAYYVKGGRQTTEVGTIKQAVAPLIAKFGTVKASQFGPSQLKQIRQVLIDAGLARRHINQQIQRIRRIFRWAVEHEHVKPEVLLGLKAVADLPRGRSPARESEEIPPVDISLVQQTLPHLTPTLADMVRVQLAAGMRPGELVIMTPADLDRSIEPWVYKPSRHKGEHIERDRLIYLGPEARSVLLPRLERLAEQPDAWVFPTDRRRRGTLGRYSTGSYRVQIQRTCRKVGLHPWFPLQLRHSAGTLIRKKFGLEAAQVVLGHAKADVTEIYAQKDRDLARQVAEHIG